MLFHLPPDQRLDGITAILDVWNDEADRFRMAADAARKGQAPTSLLVAATEEAHDGLMHVLDELDRALDALPGGHQAFSGLLTAQTRAIGLLESIGNSMDVLMTVATDEQPAPLRLHHARAATK